MKRVCNSHSVLSEPAGCPVGWAGLILSAEQASLFIFYDFLPDEKHVADRRWDKTDPIAGETFRDVIYLCRECLSHPPKPRPSVPTGLDDVGQFLGFLWKSEAPPVNAEQHPRESLGAIGVPGGRGTVFMCSFHRAKNYQYVQ